MTDYTIPADIREWVERTAPRMTVADWPAAERVAGGDMGSVAWLLSLGVPVDTPLEYLARALLAYLDEVALAFAKRHARKIHPNERDAKDWHEVIAERARELGEGGGA